MPHPTTFGDLRRICFLSVKLFMLKLSDWNEPLLNPMLKTHFLWRNLSDQNKSSFSNTP